MDATNHPSLSIRPTQSEIRKSQLKDLEKPGYVVILHTGETITKPEVSSGDLVSALAEEPNDKPGAGSKS